MAWTSRRSLTRSAWRSRDLSRSCADALAWAEHATPDVALLDYLLKDGPCTALVRTLLRRGVPVLIYSGIRQDEVPPDLRPVTWIEKPVEAGQADRLRAP